MPTNEELDKRLKRLETLHIWAIPIVAVGLLMFFGYKKNKQ